MIAPYQRSRSFHTHADWHQGFLAMLPTIREHARIAFRHLSGDARDDAVQEVVANALVAYVRLVELGKVDLAYPTVLASYAERQVCDGRRVGSRQSCRDVLSEYAQRRKGFNVARLDCYNAEEGGWQEAVVPDNHRPVSDQAAFRIDFPAWLKSLSRRNRRIAQRLGAGYTTGEVAHRHRLSPARVSQLRRELHASWHAFQNETVEVDDA